MTRICQPIRCGGRLERSSIDADVLEWFQAQEEEFQRRMNAALRTLARDTIADSLKLPTWWLAAEAHQRSAAPSCRHGVRP